MGKHGRMLTVLEFLSDGQWHKAREIREVCGLDSRGLRLLNESNLFIGGSKGYKRTDLATKAEIDRQPAGSIPG